MLRWIHYGDDEMAPLGWRLTKGIKLGKPRGVIQASMYDKDKEKILHLYQLGVPIEKIIRTHLGYGKYLSLKAFINKLGRINND